MAGDDLLSSATQGADFSSGAGTDGSSVVGDMSRPKKTLDELRKMFDDFRATCSEHRLQSLIDFDYYDGKQLTPDEVAILRNRGQPDIIVNRTRVAINGILGIIARSNTDPKAWPRSPTEDDSASVATDCLRYVAEKSNFNRMKVELSKDNLIGGCCALFVGASGDNNVPLSHIRWEEFFYDPRSRRTDFLDARYMGIAKWMYADDVEAIYPDTANDLSSRVEGSTGGISVTDESFTDRPINQGWLDIRNKRFLVVEIYYRYGARWAKAVFWYGGVLEEDDSPYTDDHGLPSCPIIAESCYVDRDNQRYGVVRDMRDLQDEINKRRSKLLHLINSSQIQAKDPSAIEVDSNVARTEAARPDGVLPYGWQKVPTSDMAQGQMLLLTEAKNEMERFGPNPAVLGRQGADTSGRALLARQQAGLVELAVVLDQLEDMELRVYRAAWARIQQYWKAPQFIRVTHDPSSPQFVGINQPIPHPQAGQMVPGPGGQPMQDPQGQPGQPLTFPATLGYKNNVAEMDVDIVIDTQPATATIMQEQLKDLMDLVSANPNYAQQVPFEVFLQLMPIPRKSQIISQITTFRNSQQAAQAQQTQQQIELAVKTALAKIQLETSKAGLNDAKAEQARGDTVSTAVKTSTDTASAAHALAMEREEAVTDRFHVLQQADTARAESDESGGP